MQMHRRLFFLAWFSVALEFDLKSKLYCLLNLKVAGRIMYMLFEIKYSDDFPFCSHSEIRSDMILIVFISVLLFFINLCVVDP